MSDSGSTPDIVDFADRYVAEKDWDQDKAHVRTTSQAVRTLVSALVETGSVDEFAMRTVYNLCQNDEAFTPEAKKERIETLDMDDAAKAEITDRIHEGIGIVGKGTYSVPIEGHEEEAYRFLATVIGSDDWETINSAIEEFIAVDIDAVQAN